MAVTATANRAAESAGESFMAGGVVGGGGEVWAVSVSVSMGLVVGRGAGEWLCRLSLRLGSVSRLGWGFLYTSWGIVGRDIWFVCLGGMGSRDRVDPCFGRGMVNHGSGSSTGLCRNS